MVAIIIVVCGIAAGGVAIVIAKKNTKNETDNEKPKATITPGVGNVLGETQIKPQPKVTCETYECSYGTYLPENMQGKECSGKECTNSECCHEVGVCKDKVCPAGSLIADPEKRCAGESCTVKECCREKATCDGMTCPAGSLIADSEKRCAGESCTVKSAAENRSRATE